MVGGGGGGGGGATHQFQSQLPPPPPSSEIAPPPTTEEEEFLKRNTDCVYFLASPLTCKKGSECEYRHSDIARVNPRDCWYWLNGNCLNPKCGFRHPPLDGLLGAEAPTPVGPSIPPTTTPKQGVACIFFQKGFCLKGHLCPFLHGPPNMVNNKPMQPVQPNPAATKPSKIASAGPEKSIQEQKFMQPESLQNPVEFQPPQAKQVPRSAAASAPAPARNGGSGSGGVMKKNVAPPPEEPPRYKPASVVNEFPSSRSNHGVYEAHYVSDNDGFVNGKDVDEYSREPTPGFDVLVDNEHGDSEYYPNEEQFGRSRGHDFDIGRSTEYDVDRDMYGERRDYDRYNEEGYAWEDRRTSSERMLGEASNFGRKRYPRDDSPDQFDKSDLRHRISKQRRGNVDGGLRSVVSSEHLRDSRSDRMPRTDSHHHRHHHHRDRRLEPGSLSSRLRGRIKIPGRSMSPGNGMESRVEREIDMGRHHRSRYSPGRPPHVSSNHSRLRDRIKGRTVDDFNDRRGSREMASDNGNEFSGPRRLSELKSEDDRHSLGKRKYPREENQQSDGNLSFEGPKPLSEILKRKRGGSVVSSVNNEDNNNDSNRNNEKGKEIPSEPMVDDGNKEEPVEKQSGSMDGQDSLNDLEKKAGSLDEEALLDQELEAYDGRDGDYDYEQMEGDGEEYNLEEGEEEYLEEDYGDDDVGKKEKEVYS